MSAKKYLFPSLCVGAALAFTLRRMVRAFHEPTLHPTSYDGIDAYVEAQMRRLRIPGASLAIVEGDRIAHSRGIGTKHPGGEPPSLQTPFFIGSLTKSITALGVMQLVEAGRIELDAPVLRYLPWFRVADEDASARMTVRHLLNQTSGLPTLAGQAMMADFDPDPGATERQVRSISALKTNPVGQKVEYSNLNYNILGLIIEAASGETYASYIQEHIYSPLEMRHSYTSKADALPNDLAMGHRHWFSLPFPAPDLPVPAGSLPSGQLISCAEDMAHYLIAHLNHGRYGEVQVLSNEGMNELHRGVQEYITFGVSSGKYAMGWFDADMGGKRVISHSGNVPEYSAFMALLPDQKKGIVLLFNADPYGLPPITEEIGLNTTALLAGQQPHPDKLDYIQWVMRLLPLLPLLQVIGAIATIKSLHSWQRHPEQRPGKARVWFQHILLPLVPNLSLAFLLEYLRGNGLMSFMRLFMPDLAWIIQISGEFARIWAFLRTRLMLHAIQTPPFKAINSKDLIDEH